MEFGTRRAQEIDAAVWEHVQHILVGLIQQVMSEQANYLIFQFPELMLMHSFQTYGDEYKAFKIYAERHKNCVFLVDTFHTLKSGVPTAIKVAKELGDSINFIGIRLDSGDIAYLSKKLVVCLMMQALKTQKSLLQMI